MLRGLQSADTSARIPQYDDGNTEGLKKYRFTADPALTTYLRPYASDSTTVNTLDAST